VNAPKRKAFDTWAKQIALILLPNWASAFTPRSLMNSVPGRSRAFALRKRNSATPLVGRFAQAALVRFQDLDEDRQLLVAR
jgi:hypothetical protein